MASGVAETAQELERVALGGLDKSDINSICYNDSRNWLSVSVSSLWEQNDIRVHD